MIGYVIELAGVWFVTDKLRYSTGLFIGILLAAGMAINMAVVLQDAVDLYGGEHAQGKIIAKSILRYLIVVIVFFVMMKFEFGNLFSAFIGVLGLKVAAYMQPLTHKLVLKLLGGKATPTPSDSDKMKSEKEVKL